MAKRSKARSDPKRRPRKKPAPKRRAAPKVKARSRRPAAADETAIARPSRELNDARDQLVAMSEVLHAISRSKFELSAVLESVAEAAARLCRADGAVIFQLDGGLYRFAAGYSLVPAKPRPWFWFAATLAATFIVACPPPTIAQQAPATAAPAPAGTTSAAGQDAASPTAVAALPTVFSRDELEKLLAPFALYPDALLAQLLPASAYPLDIVQASRWLAKNKAAVAKGDFSGLDDQGWDSTVKALARFPDVISKLNDDLDATTDLGDAFVNQPKDVADVIQDLRRKAQKAGSLKTTEQQRVSVQAQGGDRLRDHRANGSGRHLRSHL